MTTPTKTTPAKQAPAKTADKPVESEAAKASRIGPLDLASLRPVKVAAPVRNAGAAGRTARDNSAAEGWLADLNKTRKPGEISGGLGFQIPAGAYGELRSRLNQAARKLGVGVSISPSTKPDVPDEQKIDFSFAVQDRRTYNRKKGSDSPSE